MSQRFCRYFCRVFFLGVLLLSACASEPVLLSKSAVVPADVDLTGYWQVRDDPTSKGLPEAGGASGELVPVIRRQRSRTERRSSGVSAQVFLEFGETLKITQTDYGLFISYDRSVVEEYTFGENRLVAIGPIEAKRVSGWEHGAFVVETLDQSGTALYETWKLAGGGAVLTRDIRIGKGEKDSFVHRQVFDRQ